MPWSGICVAASAMFTHFISMYTLTPEQMGGNNDFLAMSADELAAIPLRLPKGE